METKGKHQTARAFLIKHPGPCTSPVQTYFSDNDNYNDRRQQQQQQQRQRRTQTSFVNIYSIHPSVLSGAALITSDLCRLTVCFFIAFLRFFFIYFPLFILFLFHFLRSRPSYNLCLWRSLHRI